MHVAPSILSSFVTLFVTIGPVETAVVFASLTAGVHRSQRRSLALRSVTIAGVITMLLLCVLLTLGAMRAAERLIVVLGRTGADVVSRVPGILLAGLAVRFVFDGLAQAPFVRG